MSVDFDPFSAEFFDDPSEIYRQLRDDAPVYFSDRYGDGFYALSRYDDVVAAHKDWETFSSSHGIDLSLMSQDPEDIASYRSLIMMDPPSHDRFRSLVNRVFTPAAIKGLEPMVRQVIDDHLDALDGRTEFDAVAEFSGPFPVEIISVMLGVPREDRQQIRHWLDLALTRRVGEMHPSRDGLAAATAMGVYFYELSVAKRASPADDLTSRLTQVTVTRDAGESTGLDDAEIAGFAALLAGAGAETVTKLVGNAFVLFDRNPSQWHKVLDDRSTAVPAVEEILRYLPPSQYQGRYSLSETRFRDDVVPAGFPVLLVTGAATRDERFFERPDDFDIDRPVSHALGFGLGVHSCLGAALARLESRIVIEEMAQRWPTFEVDHDGLRRVSMSNVAGYSNVPVSVTPR